MLSVRGLTATVSGPLPTGIVPLTPMAAVVVRVVLGMASADAGTDALATAGTNNELAATARMMAPWVILTMPCFPLYSAADILGSPACAAVTPMHRTPGKTGRFTCKGNMHHYRRVHAIFDTALGDQQTRDRPP